MVVVVGVDELFDFRGYWWCWVAAEDGWSGVYGLCHHLRQCEILDAEDGRCGGTGLLIIIKKPF